MRIVHRSPRAVLIIGTLLGLFLGALAIPIPALPDAGRAAVRAEVSDRLPGWTVSRLNPSWEGAYTVVTTCEGRQVSFQFVPGHGLPQDAAWIQPTNRSSRARLAVTSDHRQYLVWREDEIAPRPLACLTEVAQSETASGEPLPRGVD